MKSGVLAIVVGLILFESPVLGQSQSSLVPVEDMTADPTVVVGMAIASTIIPTAIGAELLYREKAEGLGAGLLLWGWVVGPAPFSLYYRDTTAGLVGLGVRSASVLMAAAMVAGGTWDEDGSAGTEIALLAVMAVSGVTTVLNIVGLPEAVREFNSGIDLTVAPWLPKEGAGASLSIRW